VRQLARPTQRRGAVICAIVLLTAICAPAQTLPAHSLKNSCRSFVQNFYDWYLPKAMKGQYESVIFHSRKTTFFAPPLLHALREDYLAQAKVKGEIVGLDEDPFLNSQDFSERFAVQNVVLRNGSCFAEVRGISSGKEMEYVEPELTRRKGHWIFVTFYYDRSGKNPTDDLVSILRSLKAERQRNSR